MSSQQLVSRLRARREAAGVSQEALARAAGVSRQALGAVEAGRTVPSTALALRLARALGCSVESLFALPPGAGLQATLAPAADGQPGGRRVALARVGDRWVAHALPDGVYAAADGLLASAALSATGGACHVEPLLDTAELEQGVLVAGCAPLLETLARRAGHGGRELRATWLPTNSTRALELLAAGLVHVAGLHHADGGNLAAVRARLPGRRMRIVNLTRWRQGLVVAPGNPLGVRGAADLVRDGLRLAHREPGAGAETLLRGLLAGAELPAGGPRASGHVEVATLVRAGAADTGVAIEGVALAAGLGFVPLSEERFDLVVPAELTAHPPVARLFELLGERGFRAEADALPGYDASSCGDVTELDAA